VPGAKAGQSDVTINKFVIMNRQQAHLEHSLFSRSFLEHDGQLRGPFCVKTTPQVDPFSIGIDRYTSIHRDGEKLRGMGRIDRQPAIFA